MIKFIDFILDSLHSDSKQIYNPSTHHMAKRNEYFVAQVLMVSIMSTPKNVHLVEREKQILEIKNRSRSWKIEKLRAISFACNQVVVAFVISIQTVIYILRLVLPISSFSVAPMTEFFCLCTGCTYVIQIFISNSLFGMYI